MHTFLTLIFVITIVLLVLFLLSLLVYFFNLDMKLLSRLQPMLEKIYERRKREHKV